MKSLFPASCFRTVSVFAISGVLASSTHGSQFFSNPTNVNVLREFYVDGSSAVGLTTTLVGDGGFVSLGSTDASGQKTQINGFDSTSVLNQVFTLPAPRTVGSWQIQNPFAGSYNGTSLTLSGLVGGAWVKLDSYAPSGAGVVTRSFTAEPVTALKYVATGPNSFGGGTYYTLSELKVFLDASVSQPLAGRVTDGAAFNLLTDASRIIAIHNSTNNAARNLIGPELGNASLLVDGDVTSYVKASTGNSSSRAYAVYDFDQPYQMGMGALGAYDGQPVNNWQVWTSALATPNYDLDSDWVLQYTQGATPIESLSFLFNQPGGYQHLRLTWNSQADALVELEVYGFVPEPSTALLLLAGGALIWSRRRRA